jgi:hypothetical protein
MPQCAHGFGSRLNLSVTPYDEVAITSDQLIIRRINPDQHIIQDDNRNCRRISTKAYQPSSEPNGGMSVDIEDLITKSGQDPISYVTNQVFIGSVSFTAETIRSTGLRVGYDPLPANLYHGEVWGPDIRPNKFSAGEKRALLQSATWYVQIQDVSLY